MSLFEEKEKEITIEGETFTLRSLSYGESSDITEEASEVDPVTGNFDVKSMELTLKRLVAMLKDWSLSEETEDGEEEKLPITVENVRRLPDYVGNQLQSEALELSGGRVDFTKISGAQSEEG